LPNLTERRRLRTEKMTNSDSALSACRAGDALWKILTSLRKIWEAVSASSEFLTVMVVSKTYLF
jgi:hypothetical protein